MSFQITNYYYEKTKLKLVNQYIIIMNFIVKLSNITCSIFMPNLCGTSIRFLSSTA